MRRQDGNRRSLILLSVYFALGAIIFLLWLFWEEVVWWVPF